MKRTLRYAAGYFVVAVCFQVAIGAARHPWSWWILGAAVLVEVAIVVVYLRGPS